MSRVRADGTVVLRRARGRPSVLLVVPLVSALILACGWSALWVVARWRAGVAIDEVLAAEALHGRQWSCADRTLAGFPFRITLDCRGISFAGTVDGAPAEGHLGPLKAETWLYEPSSVFITLDGPMTLASRDGRADMTLDWSGFRATMRGLVGSMKRLELVLDGVTFARPGLPAARADHVELHAGPAIGRPAEDAADTVEIAVTGAAVPLLDAVTGEAATLDGSFSGVVTRAYGDPPDFGATTVERWRAAGGRVDIADLKLGKGPLRAAATGRLGLDAEHRLSGRLDASLVGFAPLAKRYGLPLGAVDIGGRLASLIGGKTQAAAPGAVDLPITLADGSLSIGPIPTPVRLLPLY